MLDLDARFQAMLDIDARILCPQAEYHTLGKTALMVVSLRGA
jgi:hypothetical protein